MAEPTASTDTQSLYETRRDIIIACGFIAALTISFISLCLILYAGHIETQKGVRVCIEAGGEPRLNNILSVNCEFSTR